MIAYNYQSLNECNFQIFVELDYFFYVHLYAINENLKVEKKYYSNLCKWNILLARSIFEQNYFTELSKSNTWCFKDISRNLQQLIGSISFQMQLPNAKSAMNQKKWNRIFIFFFIMFMPSSETYSWKICRQESLQNIWC